MLSRARALFALKVAISLGLLAWLLWVIAAREGMGSLLDRLAAVALFPIGIAIALHAAAVAAGVARWRALLSARGLAVPFGWALRAFLVGRFIGAFTPSTTGLDGYRAFAVARRTGDVAGSASVLLLEKLAGLLSMSLVCVVVAPLGLLDVLGPFVLPAVLVIAGAALAGIVLLSSPSLLDWLARRAPIARARAVSIASAVSAGSLGPVRMGGVIALGVLQHLALSAVFCATGAALGSPASLLTLLATGNAIVIAVLLPLSIGGIGVREGVAAAVLGAAGVPAADALLIALLGYLTGQVPAILGGVLLASERTPAPPQVPAIAQR